MKNTAEEKQIKKEQKSVELIVAKVDNFAVITSNEELEVADLYRIKIKERYNKIEEERKSYVKGLNDTVKRINDNFKKLTVPLKNAEKIIVDAILSFRQKEEEKRLEKEIALQEITGDENISVSNSVPDIIETKLGSTKFTKRWTFEVVDLKKVPRAFLEVDETKITKAISNGIREIKGLKIYQKESLRTRKI